MVGNLALDILAFSFFVSFSLWFGVEQERTQRFGLQLKEVITLHPSGFDQVIIASILYFSLLAILYIVQILPGPKKSFFFFSIFLCFSSIFD